MQDMWWMRRLIHPARSSLSCLKFISGWYQLNIATAYLYSGAIKIVLNAAVESWCWKFEAQELADPDLIDKLSLSLCDTCGIESPDFEFNLLISELVTNAIDHGVLKLNSRLKESDAGFRFYYDERARRLNAITSGWISVNTERVDAGCLLYTSPSPRDS